MTIKHILISALLLLVLNNNFAQAYPIFGDEIKVTITGLGFDAMEPFISPDENIMFFNSLNSADTTDLYYATRVDDSTFTFVGLVGAIQDTSANHLDAVASIDNSNNFYWTSLGDFPLVTETLERGVYAGGNITDTTKVYGDFNVYSPGWLVMDAAISYDGNILAYTNAYFNNCMFGAPCVATIGLASKVNDSLFNKLPNTDALFSNINDTSYIVYAPQLTQDGLELYYTRLLKNTVNTEICVSVRATLADTFSLPMVIHSNLNFTPEAATPTTDKQKIYYHQRNSFGVFELFLRYRTGTVGFHYAINTNEFKIFPNPAKDEVNVEVSIKAELVIYNLKGETVYRQAFLPGVTSIDLNFGAGVYVFELSTENGVSREKLIIE